MRDLEIGVFLLPESDPHRTIELVRLCEDVGLDFVGIADSQMLWDDVYALLGAAAVQTSRIRLGPWVTNLVTRHESVVANAICTIDALSGGRAFLGVGYGDSSVKTLGLRPQRLAELVDGVERMRALVRGEEVVTEHGTWRFEVPSRHFEVYWAADGPKSLEDAGRHADAVIANGLLVPEHMDYMREHVAAGAADAGRDPSDVELVFNTGLSIDHDHQRALNASKAYLARTLCHDVSRWMPGWSQDKTREFREKYEYYHHIKDDHAIAELVPEELITRKAVAGTPEECATLLRTVVDKGFRRISLLPLGDVEQDIRLLAGEVLPRL